MTIGQLMKNLRDKGWIPRGYNEVIHTVYDKKHKIIGLYKEGKKYLELVYKKSLRDFCSKESGLWQFVCDREHRFIDKKNYDGVSLDKRLKNPYVDYDGVNTEYEWITGLDYQYWILESALTDESELEEFLLQNIKIGDI